MFVRYALLALFLAVSGGNASATDWSVDYAKSRLGFIATQSGAAFDGAFKTYHATISFDPANPTAGHATVDIDMASVSAGDPSRDAALPQADWFDVGHFAQAHFEAASFQPKGGDAYEAVGTLSIRGVKKDVVLPFTLDIQGDAATAKGQLKIVRTDFGVGQGPWKSGDTVGLDVTITVDLIAHPAPG
jgi:polyisoprenoid-binding protein YceI